MQSTRPVDSAKSRPLRRLPVLLACALLALLGLAPNASAWHGYLKIKKVVVDANAARQDGADFDFTVDRQSTPPNGAWTGNIADVPYLSNGEWWVSPSWTTGGDANPSVPWRRFRVSEIAAGGANAQPLSGYDTSFACETPFKWEPSPNHSYRWSVVMGWGAWPPAGLPQTGSGTQVTTELRWDGVAGGYATLCTFTNKRRPTIKIRKVFDGNPLGETQKVRFALNGAQVTTSAGQSDFVDGSVTNAIQLPTGAPAPTISESSSSVDLAGYSKTISCTDASTPGWSYETVADDADGSWTLPGPLAPGQDVTCVVTNRRASAKVKVIKYTDPASQQHGFDLYVGSDRRASDIGNGGSTGYVSVDPGSHTASESAAGQGWTETIPGWTSSWVCAKNPAGDPTAQDAAAGTPGTRTSGFSLAAGDRLVCAFHNSKITGGRLTLEKLIAPASDTGRFLLSADGPGAAHTTAPLGHGGRQSFDVQAGEYALSETGAAGTSDADYLLGEPVCRSEQLEQGRAGAQLPVVDGKVAVGALDDVTCTFTNTRKGRLTIRKAAFEADGVSAAASPGTFDFSVGGLPNVTGVAANDGVGVSLQVAPNASYAISELLPADSAFALTKAECAEPLAGDGQASTVNALTATANVQPGEEVVCTFTNVRKPATPPGPPTPPGSQTAGAGGSGSVTPIAGLGGSGSAMSGGARMRGTVGCASARYSSASVTGRQIRRVTFYVNGRKVKTLTRRNAGSAFRLRYRTSGLRVGSYKVRAKVDFTAASGTRSRTLSLQFNRCSPRVVRPQFTG